MADLEKLNSTEVWSFSPTSTKGGNSIDLKFKMSYFNVCWSWPTPYHEERHKLRSYINEVLLEVFLNFKLNIWPTMKA